MVKSKDLHEGTVIEVTSTEYMMFFGGYNPSASDYLAVGEQYEVKKIKRSTPLVVHLKHVDSNKGGGIYFTYLNKHIKIISQPELETVDNTDPNTLAPNEEFILVKKGDPTQFYNSYIECKDYNYTQTNEDALVFTKKIGQRKKIKNKLALMGVINLTSGMFDPYYWHQKNKGLNKAEQDLHEYHMAVIKDTPYWYELKQVINVESFKDIELRKYNKDIRKVSDTVADFDCYGYITGFINKMHNVYNYGSGVAAVIDDLKNKGLENDYPFLFSTKFDHTKFKYNPPSEKDIYVDLALKSLKLKKKDVIHYNDKGFVCVAFKTEEERDIFIKEYKNTEKVQTLYLTNDILEQSAKKKLKM
jgi:hypothetical protein